MKNRHGYVALMLAAMLLFAGCGERVAPQPDEPDDRPAVNTSAQTESASVLWDGDLQHHWRADADGNVADKAAHTLGEDDMCTACEAVIALQEDGTGAFTRLNVYGDPELQRWYGVDGRLSWELKFDGTYDEEGRLLSQRRYKDGELTEEVEFWLTDRGERQIPRQFTYYNDDGTRTVNTYDEAGQLISQVYYENEDDAVGNMRCRVALNVVDAGGITEDTVDPSILETVAVVYFWGTWCSPCTEELSLLDRLADEYGDGVTVVAVHTDMLAEKVAAFVAEQYADSKILFACDLENESYYTMLGGRGTYPYTVILDEKGAARYAFAQTPTAKELSQALDSLL